MIAANSNVTASKQIHEKRIGYRPDLGEILKQARHLAVSELVSTLPVHLGHGICDAK
jgi:hypothetical protein